MSNNLISLIEYAKRQGISRFTARDRAARGAYKTAVKIGRNWLIDADEPHIDHRTDGQSNRWKQVNDDEK